MEKISQKDLTLFESGKQAIHLSSLSKLDDPIPLKNRRGATVGPRYTTLEKFIAAKSIKDL